MDVYIPADQSAAAQGRGRRPHCKGRVWRLPQPAPHLVGPRHGARWASMCRRVASKAIEPGLKFCHNKQDLRLACHLSTAKSVCRLQGWRGVCLGHQRLWPGALRHAAQKRLLCPSANDTAHRQRAHKASSICHLACWSAHGPPHVAKAQLSNSSVRDAVSSWATERRRTPRRPSRWRAWRTRPSRTSAPAAGTRWR